MTPEDRSSRLREVTRRLVATYADHGGINRSGEKNLPSPDLVAGILQELLAIDLADWDREMTLLHDHYSQFGDRLPAALKAELETLEQTIKSGRD